MARPQQHLVRDSSLSTPTLLLYAAGASNVAPWLDSFTLAASGTLRRLHTRPAQQLCSAPVVPRTAATLASQVAAAVLAISGAGPDSGSTSRSGPGRTADPAGRLGTRARRSPQPRAAARLTPSILRRCPNCRPGH